MREKRGKERTFLERFLNEREHAHNLCDLLYIYRERTSFCDKSVRARALQRTFSNRTNLVSRLREVREDETSRDSRERERESENGNEKGESERVMGRFTLGCWNPICMRGSQMKKIETERQRERRGKKGKQGAGNKKKRKAKLGERHSSWSRNERRQPLENRSYVFCTS